MATERMTIGMLLKTSHDSPLVIAELPAGDATGWLGLTLCPGKKDRAHGWDRDLDHDLHAIRSWGASLVITLIEDHEFAMLGVADLGERVSGLDMEWLHLPIRDVDVPDARFEAGWQRMGPSIHRRLERGERILIHCRGGLGRTGLVAGLILVERGVVPRDAILRVRAARPHAIETRAQERYVLDAALGKASPSK